MVKKIITFFSFTATGFTITLGLLYFIIVWIIIGIDKNSETFFLPSFIERITMHYSDCISWGGLFFFLPLLLGLIFYFWIRRKIIHNAYLVLCFIIFITQITSITVTAIWSYNYWGYCFKRPTVFKEINQAVEVFSCSEVSNQDSTGYVPLFVVPELTFRVDAPESRTNLYYDRHERTFMAMQDNLSRYPLLYNLPNVYNDKSKKITRAVLGDIEMKIHAAHLIDSGDKNVINHGDRIYMNWRLSGMVTEFRTTRDSEFLIVTLQGGQVANDHYPFYEFLFLKEVNGYKLIKRQKFYVDFAGIEGKEFSLLIPVYSFVISIGGIIGAILIAVTLKILRYSKRKRLEKEPISTLPGDAP